MSEKAPDKAANEALVESVYEQLRAIARVRMAEERGDHTLSATALVHEAFLKLVGPREVPFANRAHFYAAAAEAMRRVLLDHARSKGRKKRGGDGKAVAFDIGGVADLARAQDFERISALDAAFRRLEDVSADAANVVRLRFYAGLPVDAVAEAMGVSPRSVDRLWSYARAWLFNELREK